MENNIEALKFLYQKTQQAQLTAHEHNLCGNCFKVILSYLQPKESAKPSPLEVKKEDKKSKK